MHVISSGNLLWVLAAILAQPLAPPPDDVVRSWEVRLERLAKEIEASLKNPAQWPDDSSRWWTFLRHLEIAERWPRPEFRQPLHRILRGNDPLAVPWAASALLRYHDPAIEREIYAMVDDDRIGSQAGCFVKSVGTNIRESIIAFEFDQYKTMNCLLDDLRFGDESARFDAFLTLLELGIVLDAQPMIDQWSSWSNDVRQNVVHWRTISLGAYEWRIALEVVASDVSRQRESPKVAASLLMALARERSNDARQHALSILTSDEIMAVPRKKSAELIDAAFTAMALTAQPDDLQIALSWTKAKRRDYQCGGWGVLAGIDLEEAQLSVTSAMSDPDHLKVILSVLQERDWRNEKIKLHYLQTVSDKLNDILKERDIRYFPEGARAMNCIRTLEAMTGLNHGQNGYMNPGGFSVATARCTAKAWRNWIEASAPAHPDQPTDGE